MKITKKPNIVMQIETERNLGKKEYLLNKRNRSIKSKINIINILYYIVAIIISYPAQLTIKNMISEITDNYHYYTVFRGDCH